MEGNCSQPWGVSCKAPRGKAKDQGSEAINLTMPVLACFFPPERKVSLWQRMLWPIWGHTFSAKEQYPFFPVRNRGKIVYFYTKVAVDKIRRMGSPHNPRVQASSFYSLCELSSGSDGLRSIRPDKKRGCDSSIFGPPGVCEQYVSSTKEGREVLSGHKPLKIELVVQLQAFQAGGHPSSQGRSPSGRLVTMARLKGCISHSSHSPSSADIPTVHME